MVTFLLKQIENEVSVKSYEREQNELVKLVDKCEKKVSV